MPLNPLPETLPALAPGRLALPVRQSAPPQANAGRAQLAGELAWQAGMFNQDRSFAQNSCP